MNWEGERRGIGWDFGGYLSIGSGRCMQDKRIVRKSTWKGNSLDAAMEVPRSKFLSRNGRGDLDILY